MPFPESKRRSESEETKLGLGSAYALNRPNDSQVGLITWLTGNHPVSVSFGLSCEHWSCEHLQNIGQPSVLSPQPAKGTAVLVT